MQAKNNSYEIVLTQDLNFHSKENFVPIYDNFFLVYYFTNISEIRLKTMKTINGLRTAKVQFKEAGEWFFHETHKDPLKGMDDPNLYDKKRIKYIVNKSETSKDGNEIEVWFRVDTSYQKVNICIQVDDRSDWICKNLKSRQH